MRLALVAAVCLSMFGLAAGAGAQAAATKMQTDIPAQGLGPALKTLAKDRGFQVVFRSEVVGSTRTQGAAGNLTTPEALTKLLEGTDLAYAYLDENTITIISREFSQATVSHSESQARSDTASDSNTGGGKNSSQDFRVAQVDQASAGPQAVSVDQKSEKKKQEGLEEIVVTGTSIRGVYPESSPLQVYTIDEIRSTGATTVEQFFDRLPMNVNTLRTNGTTASSVESNERGVNGIDLRGLGVGTTLVLVNGRRLAPSSEGRTTDISLIPLSAVERVEILTDGASAIYGSDAVGGVVNFILRDDFQGADTDAGYGSVTSGRHDEAHFNQVFGTNWGSGNALLSLGYQDQTQLRASDRSYAAPAGIFSLLPEDERENVFVSATQNLTDSVKTTADALFSYRSSHTDSVRTTLGAFPQEYTIDPAG